MYSAIDDVSGDPLKPNMVMAARKEELDYFKPMHVYNYAPLTECIARTKKEPIGTRWIDTNRRTLKPQMIDLDSLPRNTSFMQGQIGLRLRRRSRACDC